jgi:dihydrodipicolinate synthase/N-acetylneuraminate lyase
MTPALPLRGVWPMLATPFHADLSLDRASLARQCDQVLAAGAVGVAVLGLAGEPEQLTREERRLVAAEVVRAAAGLPVLVGIGGGDAVTLAQDAQQVGAACVLLPPPTGVPGVPRTQEAAPDLDLARIPMPVVLQDAPAYLGAGLPAAWAAAAARRHPQLVAVKAEGLPVGSAVADAVRRFGLPVLAGNGGLYALDAARHGAQGLVPGSDLATPMVRLWTAAASGRWDEALERHRALAGLLSFELQSLPHFVACGKEVLARRGAISSPACRDPRARLDAAAHADLAFWYADAWRQGAFASDRGA